MSITKALTENRAVDFRESVLTRLEETHSSVVEGDRRRSARSLFNEAKFDAQIKKIAGGGNGEVEFDNGEESALSKSSAKQIWTALEKLSPPEKAKMVARLGKNHDSFMSGLDDLLKEEVELDEATRKSPSGDRLTDYFNWGAEWAADGVSRKEVIDKARKITDRPSLLQSVMKGFDSFKLNEESIHEDNGNINEFAKTIDGYSRDAYGDVEWAKIAENLLGRGLTREIVSALMGSRFMRAGTMADKDGRAKAADFIAYTNNPKSGFKNVVSTTKIAVEGAARRATNFGSK